VHYLHTALHITESLEEILDEWKLREKVFVITSDNAANMKKAISDMDSIKGQGCSAHNWKRLGSSQIINYKSKKINQLFYAS
jgi:hypothetical protein